MFNVVIFEDSFPDDAYPATIVSANLSTVKRINTLSDNNDTLWRILVNSNVSTLSDTFMQLEDGQYTFQQNPNVIEVYGGLSNLKTGAGMFNECYNLSKVNANLGNLIDGQEMFMSSALSSFTGDLSSLICGYEMFDAYNYEIEDSVFAMFNTTNLDNLQFADYMFAFSLLTEFTYDLKSLRRADSMFYLNNALKKFCSDTSKLVEAPFMFCDCPQLSDFIGDLSSLAIGQLMFSNCRLNAKSVMYIAETIRDLIGELEQYTSGKKEYISLSEKNPEKFSQGFCSEDINDYAYAMQNPMWGRYRSIEAIEPALYRVEWSRIGMITIGIDVAEDEIDGRSHEQQKLEFANAAGYSSWEDLNNTFLNKGWEVEWQFNGPVQSTYRMTRNKKTLPVYAKLIEIKPEGQEEGKEEKVYTKQQKRRAKYCTPDGSKYYTICWGHEVSNTEDYTKYDSIQDVLDSNGLIRKEELQQS